THGQGQGSGSGAGSGTMAHMLALPHRSTAHHYTRTARSAARRVLRSYSTSFTLASSALPRRIRTHIEAVYAMVRVADELVDGAWAAGTPEAVRQELDRSETAIVRAAADGFSTDLVAHAFGVTARRTGIGPEQWEPFFAAMRSDIPPVAVGALPSAAEAHPAAVSPNGAALASPNGAALASPDSAALASPDG